MSEPRTADPEEKKIYPLAVRPEILWKTPMHWLFRLGNPEPMINWVNVEWQKHTGMPRRRLSLSHSSLYCCLSSAQGIAADYMVSISKSMFKKQVFGCPFKPKI